MSTYRAAVIGLSEIGAAARQPAPDPVLGEAMPHSHVAAYADTNVGKRQPPSLDLQRPHVGPLGESKGAHRPS